MGLYHAVKYGFLLRVSLLLPFSLIMTPDLHGNEGYHCDNTVPKKSSKFRGLLTKKEWEGFDYS